MRSAPAETGDSNPEKTMDEKMRREGERYIEARREIDLIDFRIAEIKQRLKKTKAKQNYPANEWLIPDLEKDIEDCEKEKQPYFATIGEIDKSITPEYLRDLEKLIIAERRASDEESKKHWEGLLKKSTAERDRLIELQRAGQVMYKHPVAGQIKIEDSIWHRDLDIRQAEEQLRNIQPRLERVPQDLEAVEARYRNRTSQFDREQTV